MEINPLQKRHSHENSKIRGLDAKWKRRKSGQTGFNQHRQNGGGADGTTFVESFDERPESHLNDIEKEIASYYSPYAYKHQSKESYSGMKLTAPRKTSCGYDSPDPFTQRPVGKYPTTAVKNHKHPDALEPVSSTTSSDDEKDYPRVRATHVYLGGKIVFNSEEKHCVRDGFESASGKRYSTLTQAFKRIQNQTHNFGCSALKCAPEQIAQVPFPSFRT